MKPHYSKAVEDNYPYYFQIKSESKKLISNIVYLSDRENHRGQEEGEISLQADAINGELLLVVEGSKSCQYDFKFKIFNRTFMPQPCFRFDSDGETHTNLGDIPLPERQIRPPHFHEFNESGVEFAYKTNILTRDEHILLKDRSFALAHFSYEENIICSQAIEIVRYDLFDHETTVHDPLSGETFNEQ